MRWLFQLLLCLLATFLALTATVGGQPPTRQLALVIGNNAYPQSPLVNAVNDAKAVASELRRVNFEVRSVYDADLKTLQEAIEQFSGTLLPGDVGLFYYAGHGIQLDGENYLIPVDFRPQNEETAKALAYSASKLRERMESSGTNVNIIILDACRNNPFPGARSMFDKLAPMKHAEGTFIALSTSPGRVASDNGSSNGPFASALVEALREPGLTLNELFDKVKIKVRTATQNTQIPWTESSIVGEFYFRPPPGWTMVQRHPKEAVPPKPVSHPPIELSGEAQQIADGHYREGVKEFQKGRYETALASFEKAIGSNPSYGQAFLHLGLAQAKLNQYREAIDSFSEAVGLMPDSLDAFLNRGIVYTELAQYNQAVEDFNQVIKLNPDYAKAYWHRSTVLSRLGKVPEAAADFRHYNELKVRKSK